MLTTAARGKHKTKQDLERGQYVGFLARHRQLGSIGHTSQSALISREKENKGILLFFLPRRKSKIKCSLCLALEEEFLMLDCDEMVLRRGPLLFLEKNLTRKHNNIQCMNLDLTLVKRRESREGQWSCC